MRRKLLLISFVPLLFTMLGTGVMKVAAVEYPAIYVDPPSIIDGTLTPGENFTVSIKTDYAGDDINGYHFTLLYNPQVVRGVEVTNGDLITADKDPRAQFLRGDFNTAGELSLTAAFFFHILPPPFVTSGPGTLANVTFTVVGTGDSAITLGPKTKLIGWDSTENEEYNIIDGLTMPFHIGHGYFWNEAAEHDVAVIGVAAAPTEVVEGELVGISVEVENQGSQTENVTIEVYYNYQPGTSEPGQLNFVGTKKALNLPPGERTSLTFSWNTTYVPAKEYNVTAVANELSGEADLQDNVRDSDESITVEAFQVEPIPVFLVVGIVMAPIVLVAIVILILRRGKPRYYARE